MTPFKSRSHASKATVSIVSHGHGLLLHDLLGDLRRQRGISECRIVLTLNIADERFDAANHSELDLVVVRNAAPKGFGANHNAAFRLCDSPWLLIVNPDIRLPDPGTIEALIQVDDRKVDVGISAPRVVNSLDQPEDAIRSNLTPWSLAKRAAQRHRAPLQPEYPVARRGAPFFWFAGMFLAARSAAFQSIGGFDERFFLYCEDYDLCARSYLAGYALVHRPEVRVVHDAQRDSHRSRRHLAWHLQSLVKVWSSAAFWRLTFRKHLPPA